MSERIELGLVCQEESVRVQGKQQSIVETALPATPAPAGLRERWSPAGLLGSVLKRYQPQSRRLQIRETLSLGGRRSVALIECDGERFLATMSSDEVHALVRLDDDKFASTKEDLR